MRKVVVTCLVAVALAACAKPVECKLTPIPPSKYEPAFLWRVHKGDGDSLWLYGTIHDAGIDAVPEIALSTFEHQVRIVTELGATSADPELLRKYARIQKGPGIDQQLLAGDWYDLRDALRGKINEDELRRAAPWYAMSLLTTYLAPSPGPSMDTQFGKRAEQLAMPIEALETWEEQLSMLDRAVTISDLQEAIEARSTMKCELDAMLQAYQAGDTATMTRLLVSPRTANILLYARNRVWMPKLEAYIPKGGAFVAVGLGHLLGDEGLPTLFEKAGYTVERTTER